MPWPLERSVAEMDRMYASFGPERFRSQNKNSNIVEIAPKESRSQHRNSNIVKAVKNQLPARPNAEMAELASKLKETRMIAESVPKSINVTDLLRTLVEVEQKAEGGTTEVEEAFKELERAQAELKQRTTMKQRLDLALIGQAINTLAPQPLLRQSQAPLMSVLGNIYYKADLTLEQAGKLFMEEARDISKKCEYWADAMPPAQFWQFAQTKRQPLNKVCTSIYAMRQLLQRGREGWDLTKWSTAIFIEAEELLPALIHRLRMLASFECSGWLKDKAWAHAHEVQRLLAAVEKQKVEREQWEEVQAEMAFGKAIQEELDMQNA